MLMCVVVYGRAVKVSGGQRLIHRGFLVVDISEDEWIFICSQIIVVSSLITVLLHVRVTPNYSIG